MWGSQERRSSDSPLLAVLRLHQASGRHLAGGDLTPYTLHANHPELEPLHSTYFCSLAAASALAAATRAPWALGERRVCDAITRAPQPVRRRSTDCSAARGTRAARGCWSGCDGSRHAVDRVPVRPAAGLQREGYPRPRREEAAAVSQRKDAERHRCGPRSAPLRAMRVAPAGACAATAVCVVELQVQAQHWLSSPKLVCVSRFLPWILPAGAGVREAASPEELLSVR